MKEGKRILVVDDEQSIREVLVIALTGRGYEVAACQNGTEALLYIQDHCYLPHLIITDLNMPKMDGIELTRRVKAALPALPVIMISFDEIEDHPADVLLSKPLDLKKLFQKIEELY